MEIVKNCQQFFEIDGTFPDFFPGNHFSVGNFPAINLIGKRETVNSLFPVKISRKVEEILFQQDKTEKLLQMAF